MQLFIRRKMVLTRTLETASTDQFLTNYVFGVFGMFFGVQIPPLRCASWANVINFVHFKLFFVNWCEPDLA